MIWVTWAWDSSKMDFVCRWHEKMPSLFVRIIVIDKKIYQWAITNKPASNVDVHSCFLNSFIMKQKKYFKMFHKYMSTISVWFEELCMELFYDN